MANRKSTPTDPQPDNEVTFTASAANAVIENFVLRLHLNDDYVVALTEADSNMDSTIYLFDPTGGRVALGIMHIAPQATESDILRVTKNLVKGILGAWTRSTELM